MKNLKEENVKLYPLTQAQDVVFLNLKWSFGHDEAVNICATVNFESEIDTNLMLQAISLAMLRNKSAALRLRKVGKETMQYFSQQAPNPVIVMDYSNETQEKYDEDILRFSSTPFPNKSMDTQLYSIRLIKKPDGFYGLYFCLNHIAFDAYSLIMTINEVFTMYECLRDGLPIPENKCNPIPLLEKDIAYVGSPQMQKDLEYFENEVFATEPLFCDACGSPKTVKKGQTMRYGSIIKIGKSKANAKQFTLKADFVNKIYAFAEQNNISPTLIFYHALRSYLSKVNNMQEDIILSPSISRRGTLAEKRAFGTRATAVKMRLNLPNSTKIMDAFAPTYNALLKSMAHANINVNAMNAIYKKKYDCPPMHGYDSVLLSYIPTTIPKREGLPAHLSLHTNSSFSLQTYLTIAAFDNSGDLVCNYDYQYATTKPDTIDNMHNHLVAALEAIITNPDITLGELAKL